jgi:hypothetical protein
MSRISSAATSTAMNRRSTILGETRGGGNVPSPSLTSIPDRSKGKEKEVTHVSIAPPLLRQVDKHRKAVQSGTVVTQLRTVSVPINKARPSTSGSTTIPDARSVSTPLLPAVQPRPRPSSSGRALSEQIVEEDEDNAGDLDDHGLVDLDWALQSPKMIGPALVTLQGPDWKMDEMRREIGNLQLDMLRMGRNIKVSSSSLFQVVLIGAERDQTSDRAVGDGVEGEP